MMGFYVRKSVPVGPLRFDLSDSGIEVSSGIPGVRVGMGPRGTYVHLGRGGLYYRQTRSPSGSATPPAIPLESGDETVQRRHTHGPMEAVGIGGVTQMVDTNPAALISEIERKRRRLVHWPFMLALSLVPAVLHFAADLTPWLTVPGTLLLLAATVIVQQYDKLKKTVVLMYELDGPALDAYQNLCTGIEELAGCGAVWHVTARGDVHDPKYHAGAGQLVGRRRISVGYRNPPDVITNLSVPFLPIGQRSLYLLPDRILMYAPNVVASVAYDALELSATTTRFIEDGTPPGDATVVDQTWKYVNKDGSPDQRFKNNGRLPVCQYEELEIVSSTGVREVLRLSRIGIGSRLQAAIAGMVTEIRNAKTAERERQQAEKQRKLQNLEETRAIVPPDTVRRRADVLPTAEDLHSALFEILCCVMVADGRASSSEKTALAHIMRQVECTWSEDKVHNRIASFINDIQTQRYSAVLRRSMNRIQSIKRSGQEKILLKCIDLVAEVDGKLSQREKDLCDLIRKSAGAASIAASPTDGPEPRSDAV